MFYAPITLLVLHAEFGFVWTTPWPDENELFLKFAKIRNSRNSKNSVWKRNYFLRLAIPKILFALHSHYTGDTRYRDWFDLNNSLTRWKRSIFKVPFLQNSKIPSKRLTFFLGKLYRKLFLFYAPITLLVLHAEFGFVWTTPWPDENELFLKFAKIRNLRNSQISVWKRNYFLRLAIPKILFALHSHYTGDTRYRDRFDLNNCWTRWKRPFFKIPFLRNSKVLCKELTFFLGMLCQKFCLFYALITLVVLHTEFGFICTTPWPDENELFLEFAKIRNARNSQNSLRKPKFFLRPVLSKILFVLHSHYTGGTPHRVWFCLDNSLTRWKWIIFKNCKNSQFAKFAKFRMKTQLFP